MYVRFRENFGLVVSNEKEDTFVSEFGLVVVVGLFSEGEQMSKEIWLRL